MAIETVTVTKQEAQMIEEAKAMRKAVAEREAQAKAYIKKKQKAKANYNIVASVLLVAGTIGLLYLEGKI